MPRHRRTSERGVWSSSHLYRGLRAQVPLQASSLVHVRALRVHTEPRYAEVQASLWPRTPPTQVAAAGVVLAARRSIIAPIGSVVVQIEADASDGGPGQQEGRCLHQEESEAS
ncbi:hypothetical protein NDU88_005127 [Pleurodeles waltl]|uniref:Uncharacterized protein n=1 Tax=Pleurodeles waltl TaxID=8319 RepID=A0AAV7VKV0_PLEWA|nr:hypothetical protein NDU88_005127 [Pleurodeles waltl]